MNIPYVFKRCSKCGRWLVASSVNFHKDKACKYGLNSHCKECRKKHYEANKEAIAEYGKKYREQNKEAIAERKKKHYEANKEAILEQHKEYYEANKEAILEKQKKYNETNKEAIAERKKEWYETNKEAIAERRKEYYEANKETIAEYWKGYREQNKEAIAEYMKEYREENKETLAEKNKRYRETPQGQVAHFNSHNRRRAKEQNQGSGITKDQWLECMSFFNWECAYSGKILTKETRSIDHVIPLNNGGENEVWNCIPMDKSLNSSKKDREMLEWYIKQPFCTAERLLKIYNWQEYAKNKYDNSIVNE